MFYIGKQGVKWSKTLRGFAIARGSLRPWVVGISLGATYASANLFMGVPGWAYKWGECVLWWNLGCFAITWLGVIVFAKKFWHFGQRHGGAITLPDWLSITFQSDFLRVAVAILVLFNMFYIAGQTIGIATLFEQVFGVEEAGMECIAVDKIRE